jgi:Reverse transcriptase (RNA-dependent DNA polymerase)
MFSRPQLERLHRHFVHPSASKLHALLRRAYPDELSSAVKLAHISSKKTTDTVFITEVLSLGDLREKRFDSAKRDEILGLINRNTFRLVSRSGENNPKIVPGRFVLAIKNPGTDKEFLKARFVLGGHQDREKRSIVHNSTAIKQSSVRLLLALTATLGFNVWTIDVNQAYLQAAVGLQRKIFTKPDVLNLGEDEILQVIKPLYGLSDSGDYWAERCRLITLKISE